MLITSTIRIKIRGRPEHPPHRLEPSRRPRGGRRSGLWTADRGLIKPLANALAESYGIFDKGKPFSRLPRSIRQIRKSASKAAIRV